VILNDLEISYLSGNGMIAPFEGGKVRKMADGFPVLSYGLECFGYTIRLSTNFLIAPAVSGHILNWYNGIPVDHVTQLPILDVKRPASFDVLRPFDAGEGGTVVIPPNSYVLGYSVEHFDMPNDVLGIAVGKSTYARAGATQLVTPLEPGWRGHLTIEIANTSALPVKLYPEEGVVQIVFMRGRLPLGTYYGNYQDQEAATVKARC